MTFRCSRCRSTLNSQTDTGRKGRVVLTGKTKKHYRNGRYFNRHADGTSRQYECCDCGYVGWSSHKDLISAPTQGVAQKVSKLWDAAESALREWRTYYRSIPKYARTRNQAYKENGLWHRYKNRLRKYEAALLASQQPTNQSP